MLAVVLPAAYLLGDFSAGRFLASQRTDSQITQPANPPEFQVAPPKVDLTPAQVEFWNYLEQFNCLPDNPTEEMVAVYNAKGSAPKFHTLKASKTSVLGDIKGLTAHRELFSKRYPWVQPLLDQYEIEVPISTERFSGSAEEIGEKYKKLTYISNRCIKNAVNEKIFVTNFLEGLLVVDYLYACGTEKDKQEAMKVIDGVFRANYIIHPFKENLVTSLLTPASMDIGWPVIANYPELIWGLTPVLIRSGFSESSYVEKINFSKWLLRTEGIRKMESETEQKREQGMIQNEQVRAGLLSYSIYTFHCQEITRPRDSPGLIVIKILFKHLYPRDHAVQYQRYLTLLNAAYPKIKS